MKQSKYYKEQMDDENLKNLFDEIRNENYYETFNKTKYFILEKSKNSEQMKLTDKIKNLFLLNKLKLAIVVMIALLVAACNYPVNSVNTLGYLVTFNSGKENVQMISKEIEKLILNNTYSLKINRSKENPEHTAEFYLMLQNTNEHEAGIIKNKISLISGVENLNLTALTESHSQPVYAYALKNFLNLNIDPSNKSNESLTEEINNNLKQAGMVNTSVKVVDDSGKRRLILENLGAEDNFEIKLGNDKTMDVMKIKQLKSGDLNTETIKTEEEMREKVKQENPNLKDDDIKIIKEKDENGKDVFKVEISKED